jgi:RNA-directed DNA polymerase
MRLDELWYLAYTNIYSNTGAMTKGIDEVTLDGFSVKRVHKLINSLKADTYKPKPARRAYIPKRDGKMRPLGVPSGDDKLVQSVIKILLEQIYEPIFYDFSHGFRPNKSCHTALKQVQKTWTGTKWLIEYDIKGFFDNMNHDTMIELLEKKIDDKRFIKLVKSFLKAGYLEDWKYRRTYSGTPQGGIISPILSNIYLHELDVFMDKLISDFNIGLKRPKHPEYRRVSNRIELIRIKLRKAGFNPELSNELRTLLSKQRTLPSITENTDEYKRLRYCRYADDFICGVAGSYKDARAIKQSIEGYLKDELHLQTSSEKSGIVRLKTGAEFLGYFIHSPKGVKMVKRRIGGTMSTVRTLSGGISLTIPNKKVLEFCNKYGYGNLSSGHSTHRTHLILLPEVEIIETYNAEIRGLANYYCLASNVKSKLNKLAYLEQYSLFKTIASKRKSSLSKVISSMKKVNEFYSRYELNGEWSEVKVFQLKHLKKFAEKVNADELPTAHYFKSGTDLIKRLNAKVCEYCDEITKPVEVHHVKKLKDLKSKTHLEFWEKIMIARNRKTLVLCKDCHNLLHQGKLPDMRQTRKT